MVMPAGDVELKQFGAQVQRLIQGEDLQREETHALFVELLQGGQPDLQAGALLAALVAKGETADEIAGAWQAIDELDTVHVSAALPGPLLDNSGTGMDRLKTFNVSSAAGVVIAELGIPVARHGARALTSLCGTVDILERVGLDVECPVETVERSVRQAGVGLFNGMSPRVHPGALGRVLSQIRFGSTLNIAASLANPAHPTLGLRGVHSERLLEPVARAMAALGYQRALVVHGLDAQSGLGMDELSPCGSTLAVRLADGEIQRLELTPADAGMRSCAFEAIAALGDLEREAQRFVRVIAGMGHDACVDFTCLNAGAALWVADDRVTLKHAVRKAREVIGQGRALERLRRWVAAQGGEVGSARLEALLQQAGVR
jgi:anthranilate phosphoribosyltransferase